MMPHPKKSSAKVVSLGVSISLGILSLFCWIQFSGIISRSDDFTTSRAVAVMEEAKKVRRGSENKKVHRETKKIRIPQQIVVVDTRYETIKDIPEPYQSNVQHTIAKYGEFWGHAPNILYYNEETCRKETEGVSKQLLEYYSKERNGSYKSDLCRYAALYKRGGYYFDNDMQVVQPLPIDPLTTFMSPMEWKFHPSGKEHDQGLFNSFIAVEANHPILHTLLFDIVPKYYRGEIHWSTHMGTGALYEAYKSAKDKSERVDVGYEALAETKLSDTVYPDFPRLDGVGCCCDFVVHSNRTKQVYFYSHIVGDPKSYTCKAK